MPRERRPRGILGVIALGSSSATWIALLLLVYIPFASAQSPGDAPHERFVRFLTSLQSKKYYDVALDYLDELESSPETPSSIKNDIALSRARTLQQSIDQLTTVSAKEKRLEETSAAYAKFIAEQPNHPELLASRVLAAEIVKIRAAYKMHAAKNQQAAKKSELEKQAAELSKLSGEQFTAIRDEIRAKLEPLKVKADANQELTAEEKVLRTTLLPTYIDVRFKIAEAVENQADAVVEDAAKQKQLLETALAEYKDLSKDYAGKGADTLAVLAEARVQKKLKDFAGAVKTLSSVLEAMKVEGGIVKDAARREIGLTALLVAMECWLDDSQKAYPAAMAASMVWINEIQPAEQNDPNWLQLRYLSAVAHKKFADEAKAKDPKNDAAKKALSEARKLAQQVSKHDSPSTGLARKLLAEMGVEPVVAVTQSSLTTIKTFEQARDAANDAYNAAVELPEREKIIKERLEIEKDPAQLADLRKQLEEAQSSLSTGFQVAIDYYGRALQLVLPSTPIEEVNEVRFQLCRAYYRIERFDEAAIIGEFVARRFPSDKSAKPSADFAMDSVAKVYGIALKNKAPQDEVAVELRRLASIAELITKNWPNEESAATALRILISIRIGDKDYDGVMASLAQIPEASPFRAEAESKAGQAFWNQFLIKQHELRTAAAPGAPPVVDPAAEQIKAKAIELLQSSIKRFGAAPPTTASIAATVALADVYVKAGNPQQAAAMLDDPATGPMVLLDKEETKGLFNANLSEQACRAALAAQLALIPTAADSAPIVAKANQAMEKLSEILKNNEGGDDQRVVAVYYTLARDMKQQLDLTNDPKIKANLAAGAEKFLIGVRGNTQDPKLLQWVGESFLGFGESFDLPSLPNSEDAKRFYSEAANTYAQVLKLEADKAITLDPNVAIQVRVRLASARREMGQYKEALDEMIEILTDPNQRTKVNFQLEAVRILLDWGADKSGKELYFKEAIEGRNPDPAKKNEKIVWGLAKLSTLTRGKANFADAFFESRYLIALSYLGHSKKATGEVAKQRLTRMKNDLAAVYQLYPQLGGPEMFAKFDSLTKRMQRELGEPDAGISALKKPAPAATGGAKATPTNSGS